MDVVDENQGSRGIIGSPVRRKVSAASRAASSASPLAERARDAQGVVMESQRQAAGGGKAASGRSSTGSNGASKRARRTGKEAHGSRRETASNLELAGVLEALGSPSTGEVVMEEAAVGGEAIAAAAKKSRMRHKRRMTADILDINNIFDDSMSSDGPAAAAAAAAAMAAASPPSPPPPTGPAEAAPPAGGSLSSSVYDGLDFVSSRSSGSRRSSLEEGGGADQMMAGAEEADGGDETADFSAIFKLVAQGTTPAGKKRTPPAGGSQAGGAGGGSSTPRPAGPPRARHHSNQKPGRDSLAQGLVEPASLPPGALRRVGSGAGGVKEVAPAANNPAAPTEWVPRPQHSISRAMPPANWEDLAVPTPGLRHRDSLRPSHQPTFHSPNDDSAASGISGTPGSGSGETGDVGNLLADWSANSMISSAGGEVELDQGSAVEDDGQYTAMNVDAVMAELESDGLRGRGEVRGCDDRPTAVDMDARVAELAGGGGGGGTGGKKKRRNTAEKLTVDSLLESLDSPPVQSSSGTRLAETPRDSAEGGGATPEGAAEPSGVDATSEQRPVLLPKAGKRSSRRDTVDPSDFQDLLQDPDMVTPTSSPAAITAVAADAVALGDGSSSLAASSPGEQGAAAAATPGSGRSVATAVSMRGVFEPICPSLGGFAEGDRLPVGGGGVVTPRFDRRVSGSGGGGRKDSGGTAGNGSVCGLLDSTPSPGGGLDQSFGEGEGRGKLPPMTGRAGAIAAILDSGTRGGRSSAKAAKNARRNTCEPEEFGDVIADLDSEPDTPASSRDDSRVGEDAASPREKEGPVETLSTPSSSSSHGSFPEASGPAAQQAEQEAAANAGAGGPEERMDVDTDEDSFDSPGGGSEDESKPKERDDRRSTASPTTLGALLEDLGAQGEDETDEHGTVNSTEVVKASPPQGNESGPSDDGAAENTSPVIAHTPSPPVARRTRSKSPASIKRANVGELGLASPRPAASARNKRSSMSISASPASKASQASVPQPAPESARGRLKSCLSSRKRARGGPAGVTSSSSGRSPSTSLGTPDVTNSAGTDGSLAMSGRSPSPSRGGGAAAGGGVVAGAPHGVKTPGPSSGVSGGGGRWPASDMGLESPRRVMFGAPMAAEFNHLSPSNRLTPMPSRDAKSLFPLEKQEEAETDEDEDTAANSAQLAEWEGVEPMGAGDLEFDDFDGVNGAGSMFSPEQEAFSKTSPSSRNRRRDSLAIKSPVRKSIMAYSEDVRAMGGGGPPSPYDSDFDPAARRVENLNASLLGPAASAAKRGASAASYDEPQNRSFSINNSQLHRLNDSDSSLELTGTFTTSEEFRINPAMAAAVSAPRDAAAAGADGGGGVGAGGAGDLSRPAAGGAGEAEPSGGDADVDDSMDLNESSELESTLHGASIRDAASPAPDPKRLSSGSLLSVVDDVEEFEEEVLSQASGEKQTAPEGDDGPEKEQRVLSPPPAPGADQEKEQRVLSPPPAPGADQEKEQRVLSPPPAPGADQEKEQRVLSPPPASGGDQDHGSAGRSWVPSLAFGQGENARLATVVEEMSPNSLLSSDQSHAQSRRWESLGGASADSTFELQADIMDSMSELMGPATGRPAPASKSAPPPPPPRLTAVEPRKRRESVGGRTATSSTAAGAEAKKRRESVGGRFATAGAPRDAGEVRRRRQSVGGPPLLPPTSPTVELSGALEGYMGDEGGGQRRRQSSVSGGAAAAALGSPTVELSGALQGYMGDAGADAGGQRRLSSASAGAAAGVAQGGGQRRRRQSSVGGATPASPTVELSAELMGYANHLIAGAPAGEAAAAGVGKARPPSLGPLSPAPASTPAGNVNAEVDVRRTGPSAEEGEGEVEEDHNTVEGTAVAVASSPPPAVADAVDVQATAGEGTTAVAVAAAPVPVPGRPPVNHLPPRRRRASVSAAPSQQLQGGMIAAGLGGDPKRRASLQEMMRQARRSSFATGDDGVGAKTQSEGRRESAAGRLRRRLSSVGSVHSGQEMAAVAEPEPQSSEEAADGAEDQSMRLEDGAEGEATTDEFMEDATEDDDLTENVAPLRMSMEDLIKFAAPEGVGSERRWPARSMVVPLEGTLSRDRLRDMPDELVYAIAGALDDAAIEMEEWAEGKKTHAVNCGEMAWKYHSQVPILGEIDRVIAEGEESSAANGELVSRVRGLATQIKAGMERQIGAWEVTVLTRIADEATKVLSKFSQSREALVKRGDELEELVSHADLAEKAIAQEIRQEEHRASMRSQIAKTAERTKEVQADVCGLEEELAALELRQHAVAAKKAALLEGKARREERAKAAAKRSASVVRLMELEAKSIGLEKEALEMKEKLDVQLGLRLWCQPITLLPDKVMVAFAAPHDWGLKHQLKFVVDESSAASGTCTMIRGTKPEKRGVFSKKGGMATVGDMNSASGRLSRLIFEGKSGIFGGAGGMAVAGLAGVESVAGMRTEVQNAEWFVSRAYSLLQEVHDLEKKYACTVTVVERDGASAAVEKATVLCVEVANWRSKQKLVRLRFGLSTSFACLVGAPQVEVDIGSLKVSVVDEAIRKAGGDRAGLMSITKGVEAAAACM